jgi:hypothetical protein
MLRPLLATNAGANRRCQSEEDLNLKNELDTLVERLKVTFHSCHSHPLQHPC